MDVDQRVVLLGTAVRSIPACCSVSKTSDTKVSELQKKTDGPKMISGAQQLRIQELEKNNGTYRNDCVHRQDIQEKIFQ